jgi:hypothetical protein
MGRGLHEGLSRGCGVIKFIFRRKKRYMDWDSYERYIGFRETFQWQQDVRRQNVRNLESS